MFRPEQNLTVRNAAAVLQQGLQAIAAGQREIDLASLTAVDSSAVAVLLAWQRASRELGRPLAFRHFPVNLQSLIELYGVEALLAPDAAHAPT